MSSYPTWVTHFPGLSCNVLLISRDRDLGSAMRRLKRRRVTVMLAYTGDETKHVALSYLFNCLSKLRNKIQTREVFHI